jgi:hypothetical protein
MVGMRFLPGSSAKQTAHTCEIAGYNNQRDRGHGLGRRLSSVGLVDITSVICRAKRSSHKNGGVNWKTIRGLWPYALLGITAVGVIYRLLHT